ncbi:MAG: hypothetical protein NTZ05_22375 [Chloroflexi bacterium]|nr:hypothetical protein [Chloroflexota bacterium]
MQGNGTPVNWGLPFWFVTRLTGAEPDLTLTALELSASSVEAGKSLTIQYTVKNIGPGDAPQTDLRAVLSPPRRVRRLGAWSCGGGREQQRVGAVTHGDTADAGDASATTNDRPHCVRVISNWIWKLSDICYECRWQLTNPTYY